MGMYGSPELHPAFHNGEQPDWDKNMVYCRKCGFKYSRTFDCCPQCGKKKRKYIWETWWFWVLLIVLVIYFDPIKSYFYTVYENNNSGAVANVGAVAKNDSKTSVPAFTSEKDYKEECIVISYEEIARNPNKHKFKKAVFRGYVYQVLEDGKDVRMRVAVTQESLLGLWSDIIYVDYHKASANESRILEGDIITMYGELKGLYTYESILETTVTVPHLTARFIDIEQ